MYRYGCLSSRELAALRCIVCFLQRHVRAPQTGSRRACTRCVSIACSLWSLWRCSYLLFLRSCLLACLQGQLLPRFSPSFAVAAAGAAVAFTASTTTNAADVNPVYKGFNSWDSFKGDVDEATFLDISRKMKELLLPSGYDTVTVDEFWYPDDCGSADSIDAHGRAVLNVTKWRTALASRRWLTKCTPWD